MAQILDEDPKLLQAIIDNDDNLTYGNIVDVHTGTDAAITALTDDRARQGNISAVTIGAAEKSVGTQAEEHFAYGPQRMDTPGSTGCFRPWPSGSFRSDAIIHVLCGRFAANQSPVGRDGGSKIFGFSRGQEIGPAIFLKLPVLERMTSASLRAA